MRMVWQIDLKGCKRRRVILPIGCPVNGCRIALELARDPSVSDSLEAGKKQRFEGMPLEFPALSCRELDAGDCGQVFPETFQSQAILASLAEGARQHGKRPRRAYGGSRLQVGRND
jgi:hypothetical protein